MSGLESTQLTVDFSPKLAVGIVMERSSREPDDEGTVFFRVHGRDGHGIFSTSGSVHEVDRSQFRYTSEFLIFENSSLAPLRYPNARHVRLTPKGRFYNGEGLPLSASLSYNAALNAAEVSGGPVYGIVLAEYDAPYDMWLARFGGVCPSVETIDPPVSMDGGSPDDDKEYEGRDPMMVIAEKDGKVEANLSLEPDACTFEDGESYYAQYLMGSDTSEVVVEVDPDHTIDFLRGSKLRLQAGCKVRAFPADSAMSHRTATGRLYHSSKVKQSFQHTESIVLSGASSATLKYPPANRASIGVEVRGGLFTDAWGRTFTPEINVWGDKVNAGDWVNKYTITDISSHTVKRREVAITNSFGNVIPCTGTVIVTYLTDCYRFNYEFDYDSRTAEFADDVFYATKGRETQTLTLNAPVRDGTY